MDLDKEIEEIIEKLICQMCKKEVETLIELDYPIVKAWICIECHTKVTR